MYSTSNLNLKHSLPSGHTQNARPISKSESTHQQKLKLWDIQVYLYNLWLQKITGDVKLYDAATHTVSAVVAGAAHCSHRRNESDEPD